MADHPERHVITRALGGPGFTEPDLFRLALGEVGPAAAVHRRGQRAGRRRRDRGASWPGSRTRRRGRPRWSRRRSTRAVRTTPPPSSSMWWDDARVRPSIPLRSYRPGAWFGLVGERALVVLPPTEKARVAALWELVDEGAGFDVTLDALISAGLRDLPGFVLVSTDEGQTDVVIRGAGRRDVHRRRRGRRGRGVERHDLGRAVAAGGRADADRARGGRCRRRVRAVVRRGRRAVPGLADRGDPARRPQPAGAHPARRRVPGDRRRDPVRRGGGGRGGAGRRAGPRGGAATPSSTRPTTRGRRRGSADLGGRRRGGAGAAGPLPGAARLDARAARRPRRAHPERSAAAATAARRASPGRSRRRT